MGPNMSTVNFISGDTHPVYRTLLLEINLPQRENQAIASYGAEGNIEARNVRKTHIWLLDGLLSIGHWLVDL
jgi:hypothetical protein